MTLGRAVNQGHLAPRTQWRAYSYKTSQQTQQQQQAPPPIPPHQAPPTQHLMTPPSPGSVHSSFSYKVCIQWFCQKQLRYISEYV